MNIDDQHNQTNRGKSDQDMINDSHAAEPDLHIPAESKKFKKLRTSKKASKSQTLKYALAGLMVLVLTASVFYIIQRRTEPVPTAPESLPKAAEEAACTLILTVISPTPTTPPSPTPTTPPSPTPTTPPSPTPTTPPSPTPTTPPSPTPTDTPVAAQCTDISALDRFGNFITNNSQIEQDTEMRFLCQATDPDGLIEGYQFRVLLDETGTNIYQHYTPQPPYPEFGNIVDAAADGNTERAYSDFITLGPYGNYAAQCRICSDKNNVDSCQDWEDVGGTIEDNGNSQI